MGKRTIFFIALIFISGLMVTTAGAVPVIIGFKDKAHPEMVQPYGKVTHSYKYIPAVAADLPEQAIENLKKNKNIAYIEPDYEVKALEETVPWGIERIGAPQVHASDNKGNGTNVAIIDTGIYHTHPDLNDNYKGGYDFVNNDDDPMDDNGHGTHCAGIIAAENNSEGVIGVAPEANLYALKILDSTGSGSSSNLIAAIEWAIDTHEVGDDSDDIQIISMSLGSDSGLESLNSTCTLAYEHGILLVAAAGNDGNKRGTGDSVDYPGAYSSVIAVAATDSNDVKASFSSTGPAVELAAPGVNIFSTYLGDYASASGTSMACPHVAGTAALVWAADPSSFTNGEVRKKLAQTATDLGTSGRDTLYGFGLVNAETAAAITISDTEPPVITKVNATAGTSSATITWTTDENSNSIVTYWEEESQKFTRSNYSFTTEHEVGLDNLNASTTYSYNVTSTDASGNTNTSGTYEFTTDQAPAEIEMWVNDISMEIEKAGVNTRGLATVSADGVNGLVGGATVYGSWEFDGKTLGTTSGTTDSSGNIELASNWVKKVNSGTFTFTVTDITKEGYAYNSTRNLENNDSISI